MGSRMSPFRAVLLGAICIALAVAAPLSSIQDGGCTCQAVAGVGHRDATCHCEAASVDEVSYLQVDVDANMVSRQEIQNVSCSATCDTSAPGVYVTKCVCEAVKVACPANTYGYPDCTPMPYYQGTVTWNAATMSYITGLTKATCPGSATESASGTGCDCGPYDETAGLGWDSAQQTFSPAECAPVGCPDNAQRVGDEGSEVCVCNDGYVKTPLTEGSAIPFNSVTRQWEASCVAVACPPHTTFTAGTCQCAFGYYEGTTSWNTETATWTSTCSLDPCPAYAAHEDVVIDADTGVTEKQCKCQPGYSGQLTYVPTPTGNNPRWQGTCNEVTCGANTVPGVYPCQCTAGHLDASTGTEYPVLSTAGTWSSCVATGCDFEGSMFSDDGCKCEDGRKTTVMAGSGGSYSVACSSLVPCPTGATASSAGGTNECFCDVAGYTGSSNWTGLEWTECTTVACPGNSTAVAGVGNAVDCECEEGCAGSVTWVPSSGTYLSSCSCGEPHVSVPLHSEPAVSGTGRVCSKGYRGTVVWSGSSYTSTCAQLNCPEGGSGFPECSCSTGFVGGSGYKSMGLFWNAAGDASSWEACATPPCTSTLKCNPKTCPENSEEIAGGCRCRYGYNGNIVWTDLRPVPPTEGFMGLGDDQQGQDYTGSCVVSQCPSNAEPSIDGNGDTSCACKKGYVASDGGLGWSRDLQKWTGTCVQATCDEFSTNFPDYECVRGAKPSESLPAVTFVDNVGYSGCCAKEACPENADSSTWPWCTCMSTYQAKVNGVSSYSPTGWWDPAVGYLHTCEPVACPTGAGVFPNCVCGEGYSGTTTFSGNAWTPCTYVPCPDNAERGTDDSTCVCKSGFSGLLSWKATEQEYSGECKAIDCPVMAECADDGTATCAKGYTGTVTFEDDDWVVACAQVPCPDHSTQHPDCTADVGYTTSTAARPLLTFSDGAYEVPVEEACPSNSDRTTQDNCVCKDGYIGSPAWSFTAGSFGPETTCSEAPCPANAIKSTSDKTVCICSAGYAPSTDFGWRKGAFQGKCEELTCEYIPNAEMSASGACRCQEGYTGSLTLNAEGTSYDGQCQLAGCPDNALSVLDTDSTLGCKCVAGFYSENPAVWDFDTTSGTYQTWTGMDCGTTPVECSSGTIGDKNGAKYCLPLQGYEGTVTWSTSEWDYKVTTVSCPSNSEYNAGTARCDCYQGYVGSVSWDTVAQAYVGECTEVPCPALQAVAGAATAQGYPTCNCLPSFTGSDCTWSAGRWDCDCIPVSDATTSPVAFPPNTMVDSGNCICLPGYTASDTTVQVVLQGETDVMNCPATCSVVACDVIMQGSGADEVGVAEGQPGSCTCKRGYKGAIAWKPVDKMYEVTCEKQDCPDNAAGDYCACTSGFVAKVGTSTSDNTITWDFATGSYVGTCSPIECDPGNTIGSVATEDATICECPAGTTDAFQPLVIQGEVYTGSCTAIPCPSGMGTQPDCACEVGFLTLLDENNSPVGCTARPCKSNAAGIGACTCNPGYAGTPVWDPINEDWTDVCEPVSCPDDSSGHPYCACAPGYSGSITWDNDTQSYDGNCTFALCPDNSVRETTVTSTDTETSISVKCKCEVGRAGGFEWIGSSFVGSCGDLMECPAGAGCQGLVDNPALTITSYPALPGYTGTAEWSTSASKGVWVSTIEKKSCPTGTSGHPACKCAPGYHGSTNWDGSEYSSSCTASGCPDSNMERVDTVTCRCPVGMFGSAFWDSNLVMFVGHQVCTPAVCPVGMTQSESKTHCSCGDGYAGMSTFDTATQAYTPAGCVEQGCPSFANCAASPATCLPNMKGSIVWDETAQDWDSTCQPAACPTNAKRSADGSCACETGYGPTPTQADSESDFTGCSAALDAPDNAVWSEIYAKYICMPGFKGHVTFDAVNSQLVGTCEVVECAAASQVRNTASNLCECAPGYEGVVGWMKDTRTYESSCALAFCDDAAVDCAILTDPNRVEPPPATLSCKPGYAGSAVWLGSAWASSCTFAGCSLHSAFDAESGKCVCEWGYLGVASFLTETSVGAGCMLADCPLGTTKSGDGVACQCPSSAFEGTVTFTKGVGWTSQCGNTVECPEGAVAQPFKMVNGVQEATEELVCVCGVGYKGSVTQGVSLTVTHDDVFSAVVATSSMMASSCQKVSCPLNSEDHPDCKCSTGYAGLVTFDSDAGKRSYSSTCAMVECNVPNSSGKPNCTCDEGFLGTLSYDTNTWSGECAMQACPEGASGAPNCKCSAGFYGVDKWVAGYGWDFSCEERFCPGNSAKIAGGARCQCNPGYKRDGQVDLLWSPPIGQYQGSCVPASCPANAVCEPISEVVCNDGFTGSSVNGSFVWDYEAQTWDGVCAKAECPSGTQTVGGTQSTASVCACGEGFEGSVVWADSAWLVDCTPLPCPMFATRNGTDESAQCFCDPGYVRSDGVDAALGFSEGVFTESCKAVPCPRHALRLPSGMCDCALGYAGEITFAAGQFVGQCLAVSCPVNSTMANGSTSEGFGCVCDAGFSGASWNDDKDEWEQCELVDCPDNAARYPTTRPSWMCQCAPGFGGEISWDWTILNFVGKCEAHTAQPEYSALSAAAMATTVCASVDGIAESTATYSASQGGILFDFVKETTIRCDIQVGAVDFSKIKGVMSITQQNVGVDVVQNSVILEWHNSLKLPLDNSKKSIALGTPFNIVYAGDESFSMNALGTTTAVLPISQDPVAVTPTKTLRMEVQQAAGAKFLVSLSGIETYNSVSEYVIMTTTTTSLPTRH